jgi:histidine triad (HIT) family protein
MSDTIFTKIINREIPGHFLYEDDTCVAILDKFPSVRGQSLVIPRDSIDYAFAIDDPTYQHLFGVAKRIAGALDTALQTERTCLVVEGFEVPHAHLKLYPMAEIRPLGEVLPQQREEDDVLLRELATTIRAQIAAQQSD